MCVKKPLKMEKKPKDSQHLTMLENFVDPDERKYSEILNNARRKLEKSMAPAMPCKRMVHPSITKVMQSNDNEMEFKTMCDCTVSIMKIALQEKASLLWHITICCTSFFRCVGHEHMRFS